MGYYLGTRDDLYFDNGEIFSERSIAYSIANDKDFNRINQIFHTIVIEGTNIGGNITSIMAKDVAEICAVVEGIENADPILSIQVITEDHVEVRTGIVRGPLDGGGRRYDVKKVGKKWKLDESKGIKYWVS